MLRRGLEEDGGTGRGGGEGEGGRLGATGVGEKGGEESYEF
ncbi:MAG: hypothetical protein ACHBN1_10630 [Heteroscytonema crispum UTEX LB 1556]